MRPVTEESITKDADKQITEITCHAKGVNYLTQEAKTIVDIGGQDAKVIKLDANGKVANFVMNEKCAAGTGRFLEVMARVLGCDAGMSFQILQIRRTKEISINNVCTVFAESEVISRLCWRRERAPMWQEAHMSRSPNA